MLLTEALREFEWYGASHKSARTVYIYIGHIKRFIEHVGDQNLSKITIVDLTKYSLYLRRKNYHDSTVAYAVIAIRQFYQYLFLRRYIDWDYRLIRIPKYVSNSYVPLPHKHAEEMLNKIRLDHFSGLRDKTVLSLLYDSGARNSEICALKAKDVDPHSRELIIVSKKNRKKRRLLWGKKTAELLERYLRERVLWATGDFLFVTTDRHTKGGGISTRTLQRIFAKYRVDEREVPHSARHSMGFDTVRAELHPRYSQDILGHLRFNEVYTQLADQSVKRAHEKVLELRETDGLT